MKTSDLIGPALDWAVTKCEGALAPLGNVYSVGKQLFIGVGGDLGELGTWMQYLPSTDWSQGGPIIEQEGIIIAPYSMDEVGMPCTPGWVAMYQFGGPAFNGPAPLIAAMRAFVASKLGDEVEIPEELK